MTCKRTGRAIVLGSQAWWLLGHSQPNTDAFSAFPVYKEASPSGLIFGLLASLAYQILSNRQEDYQTWLKMIKISSKIFFRYDFLCRPNARLGHGGSSDKHNVEVCYRDGGIFESKIAVSSHQICKLFEFQLPKSSSSFVLSCVTDITRRRTTITEVASIYLLL